MKEEIIGAIVDYLHAHTIWNQAAIVSHSADLYAAIAPFMAKDESGWEDAPAWARYRTVDKNGNVTYWLAEPSPSEKEGFWQGDSTYEEIKYTVEDWQYSLQRRPQ